VDSYKSFARASAATHVSCPTRYSLNAFPHPVPRAYGLYNTYTIHTYICVCVCVYRSEGRGNKNKRGRIRRGGVRTLLSIRSIRFLAKSFNRPPRRSDALCIRVNQMFGVQIVRKERTYVAGGHAYIGMRPTRTSGPQIHVRNPNNALLHVSGKRSIHHTYTRTTVISVDLSSELVECRNRHLDNSTMLTS